MAGYEIVPEGDSAMLLVFGDRISPEINTKVTAAADSLRERRIPGVTDLIPAYCSLLVQYDPLTISCEYGPDLEHIAKNAGLTPEAVIRIHSSRDYRVYMLGFLPGFCYLGGLDERIHTPRLKTPRLRIPAGSVGIGGSQTGIYPMDSPGGWQLMGRTPVRAYDPNREEPILFRAGDIIRFVPVDVESYRRITREIEQGDWKNQWDSE